MSLRRFLFWIHLSVGVVIGLVIAFLAITGSILAFQPQIIAFAERSAQIASPSQSSCVLPSDLLQNALQYQPKRQHGSATALTLFSNPHRPAEVAIGADTVVLLNSCSGQVIGTGAGGLRRFFSAVRDLHHMVTFNRVRHERLRSIKDACVLAFLFMILSGLVLWFPRKLSWQHLRPAIFFRKKLHGRAREWNWHNVFGFWMALPLSLIALTGIIMAYPWANNLLYRAAGDHPPAGRTEPDSKKPKPLSADEYPSLNLAVQAAIAQDAAWQSLEMRIPTEKDSNVTFRIDNGDGGDPRQRTQLLLSKNDGHLIHSDQFSGSSRGRQWRTYARFIHTGEMFGLIGRTVALLACFSALMLVWTGFSLALRRLSASRKRKASLRHKEEQESRSEAKIPVQEAAGV